MPGMAHIGAPQQKLLVGMEMGVVRVERRESPSGLSCRHAEARWGTRLGP